MQALLIYKNKAVRWVEIPDHIRRDYIEFVQETRPPIFNDDCEGNLPPASSERREIFFKAINNPSVDKFVVYYER